MNMDYALCQALAFTMYGLTTVLVFYDIMCQYGVHFFKRVQENPYLSVPAGLVLLKGIGLFHVHGHQDSCFAQFAPNFIKGAAQVDGEVIETLWWPLNLISASTRSMGAAHRRETLDDHMNTSNWKKLVKMGEFINIINIISHSPSPPPPRPPPPAPEY